MRKQLLATLLAAALVVGTQVQANIVTYQGRVTSAGTGFTGTGQFKFALVTVKNDAETATAAANAPSGGFITVINVTYEGFGYLTPPAVTITGGGGSGATATATIGGGKVNSITVNNPGGGYTSTPVVTVAEPPPSLSYTTHWSHDGTSSGGSAPDSFISLPVVQGLFVAPLGDQQLTNMDALDPALFQEPKLHLRVWFNDGVNGFAVMTPTQPLAAAPYAMVAEQVRADGLSGTFANQVSFNNPGNNFTGSGAGMTSLNASQLTSGTVAAARVDAAIARRADVWIREGNTGTSPATDFVGTLDNQPLEFRVNDLRALRRGRQRPRPAAAPPTR